MVKQKRGKAMKISTASLTSLLSIFILFLLTSIACADQPADSLKKDSPKYLSFYENVDGETIHWEANFLGEEITSIYKNGKRIPDDLVNDYKGKIYDQLDEMRFGNREFSFRIPNISREDFNLDMDQLHKDLEEMKKDLPKFKDHFKFYQFDSDEFKKEMEELQKELKENKPKIYNWKFDEKKLKEEMKKLEEQLEKNKEKFKNFKFHIYWDDEEDSET
jgi:chromosome segregation ATPase